jgi:hypothetical protein
MPSQREPAAGPQNRRALGGGDRGVEPVPRVPLPVPAPRSTTRYTVAVVGDPSIQAIVFGGH